MILENGLRLSRVGEVLVERYIGGWKEVEYEVMRDANGTCITVCNMENIDPVGVHTGDSIVVAPSQTLGDKEYQMLRTSALNIITELKVNGGCNVQFALNPDSFEYCVIEVNPRVSRSSALASKATGYPIAKVTAKIAIGYNLDEIPNAITGKTYASFEPMLDYCVVKMPRLPFDKFIHAKRTLTTQMKATGEVMSICNNFEGALMKAIRSLEQNVDSLIFGNYGEMSDEELTKELEKIDDLRIYVIAEAIRRGFDYDTIFNITKIDRWFLDKIAVLVEMEKKLKEAGELEKELLAEAKRLEFPDSVIGKLTGKTAKEIKELRNQFGIHAAYKMVDTCAAEFEASTPYYYSIFGSENEVEELSKKKKVMVLGSGPIRIGQGIEFDYCSVHSVWALRDAGYETIIVNNNPETVSTDFDVADKLYFEPLTAEDVESIVDLEKPDGAVVQFGGQTAIKLTQALMILEECCIPRPKGTTVFTCEEALSAAHELGYPVLVRPSYVLGGQGMQIAVSDEDIVSFIEIINRQTQEHPILIDKYLVGREVEVDAVCDGEEIIIPGIMEHIERAGIHSGDSISVYPSINLSEKVKRVIAEYTRKLAKSLNVIGLINIQFIVCDEEVYVIEEESEYYAIKKPVFSFEKLRGAEVSLGPEMKSTGECLGVSKNYNEALYKAFLGAGINLPKYKKMILTVKDSDKIDAVDIGRRFVDLGVLNENGVPAHSINKLEEESPNLLDLILDDKIDLIIDTPSQGVGRSRDGFLIRRYAIETGVTCLTSLDTADALLTSLESGSRDNLSVVDIAQI